MFKWGINIKKIVILFTLCVIVFVFLVVNSSNENTQSFAGEKVIVVNNKTEELTDIESYILGVLANEVSVDYSEETIKALAVVIRSYVVQQLSDKLIRDEEEFVLAEEISLPYMDVEVLRETLGDKVYKENIEKYEKAVGETEGEVIFYNDKIITPLYHYVSAGNTRDGNVVFGEKIKYLKSVNSPRDVESPDYLQVKECLKTEFYSEFEIIKIDDYGYVLEVDIGNDVISGEEFAKQEGLNSSCFYVEEVDDKVKIIVKGKGHGFGMSLFGAEMLAKQNYEYEKILNYYYSDIEIVKMIE